MFPFDLRAFAVVCSFLALMTAACGGPAMLTPTSTPAPAQASAQAELRPASATPAPTATAVTTPTPAATSVPTPTSVAAPESTPTSVTPAPTPARTAYDSTEIMNEVSRGLTYSFGFLEDALDRIDERNDTSMAPVLIEIVRFMPTPAGRERVGETLRTLTGQQFPADDWGLWMEWLGNNLEAFQPPSGYADWKADLYSLIDRRFAGFIRPAGDFSKIDLTEVVWGGVVSRRHPRPTQSAFRRGAECGLHGAGRPGFRRTHQRRRQSVSAPHSQRP